MLDESNFILELKNKNPLALNYVLKTFGNLIYRIAYMHTNSKELSEECVNDVLLKVWNCIDNYNYDNDKFKNWLATITKYTSIDLIRCEKRYNKHSSIDNVIISSNENIEENQISKDELNIIKNYIMDLQELDRNIIIQRFFENKDISTISKLYNLSENAINIRIMRIRKKLKTYMNNLEGK